MRRWIGNLERIKASWKPIIVSACALAIMTMPVACGTTSRNATQSQRTESSPAPGDVQASGKCRYVSASEMERITGMPTIKPAESFAGCSYLYGADVVLPTGDPLNGVPPTNLPPSIDFYFYNGQNDVDNMTRALQRPSITHIPRLGIDAGWDESNLDLRVILRHGAVMIVITAPNPPQRFRTKDLKAMAIQIFETAQNRLPQAG